MMNNIELLAPAGSYEALVAAVESGANAVYIGGNKFSARASANNFDSETLEKAVEYAHVRDVKVYVTINTLILDNELIEVFEYVGYLYSIDVDALIVQDIAILKFVRDNYPDFDVHCSTQMTIHNSEDAKFFMDMGVKRIILARELSINEVQNISQLDIQTEIFIHGALCVGYSGQCLLSSIIGGRSGNRGRCAQPCRKKYSLYDIKEQKKIRDFSDKYLLSTKDLNTLDYVEKIIDSGVSSLKIEGRMKRPEYVAIVVKNYRDVIDRFVSGSSKGKSNEENIDYELKSAFNREFTQGYISGNKNQSIVSIERPNNRGIDIGNVTAKSGNIKTIEVKNNYICDGDSIEFFDKKGNFFGTTISGLRSKGKLLSKVTKGNKADVFVRDNIEIGAKVSKIIDKQLFENISSDYCQENKKKIIVNAKITVKINDYPYIELEDIDGNQIYFSSSETVQQANKVSITKEKVLNQLRKTKNSPYVFDNILVEIDHDCNIPIRIVNEMRREAFNLLTKKRCNINKRINHKIEIDNIIERYDTSSNIKVDTIEIVTSISNYESAKSAISAGADTIYIRIEHVNEESLLEIIELCYNCEKNCYIQLPDIIKDRELKVISKMLSKDIINWDKMGMVTASHSQINYAKRYNPTVIRGNSSLNVFNHISANYFHVLGLESICPSMELNLKQIHKLHKKSNIKLEGLVYGRISVMTTQYCPVSLLDSCNNCRKNKMGYGLQDGRGKIFPIIANEFCRCKIYNSDKLYTIDLIKDIINSGISIIRADFYNETPKEVFNIVSLMKNQNEAHFAKDINRKDYTRGHYYRGVQ